MRDLRSYISKLRVSLFLAHALLSILHALIFIGFSKNAINKDPLSIYSLVTCLSTGLLFWIIIYLEGYSYLVLSISTLIGGVFAFSIATFDPLYQYLWILGMILWATCFTSAYIYRLYKQPIV